ncbi:ubinuclein-1 isoform X2 [Nematostella vectensis]|uniref:ubinuclein-1 isoform X2 n=1 Tax=Nematostella vectensis TaxID=45351 RepID=UPI0020775CBC|nr:ubinuclein-1 isoform X2 [Nematostella vectensis]
MEKDATTKIAGSKGIQNGEGKQSTMRFTLELKESSDKYFPEFSYRELLRSTSVGEATTKSKTLKDKDKIWPDEDSQDEKLKELAKRFEDKYGPKPNSKKRRQERIADLVDVTYGYDENDPFVDNSEAYDELIPVDWTTEHGGFYINQGSLNFRPISSDDSDDDFKGTKKRKTPKKIKDPNKVKKLKTPAEKERKRKQHTGSTDKEKKPKKVRLLSGDKEKKSKKKLSLNASQHGSLHSMLAGSSSISATGSASVTAMSNGVATPIGTSTAGSPPSSIKTEFANEDSIPLAQVLAANAAAASEASNLSGQASVSQNGLLGDGDEGEIVPKLPNYLPTHVESVVMKLKQAATNAADEGKCKFFNKDVNQMLLGIETQSRELSCRVRSGIYDYLAFYLPCTKDTLLKRAKKLLLTDQAGRLREPMAKLKAAVDKVMPEQIKAFEEQVRKHVEEEASASSTQGIEQQNTEDKKRELFKSAMEFEEDAEKGEEVTTPTDPPSTTAQCQTDEKTKKTVPKRKFIWSDELRELLHDVVTVKVKLFEMSKTRTTSAEEYLKEFFDTEVKQLWPKGWMTSRILFKESKPAHLRVTSAPFKAKKAPGPKKQGETSPPENQGTDVSKDRTNSVMSATSSVLSVSSSVPPALLTGVTVAEAKAKTPTTAPANVKPTTISETTKLELKITPMSMTNFSTSKSMSVATVQLVTSTSTPASSLISNIARLASSAGGTTTAASSGTSKPFPIQSLATETVGAITKSEDTTLKRPDLVDSQLRVTQANLKRTPVNAVSHAASSSILGVQKQPSIFSQAGHPVGVNPAASSPLKSQPVTILDFADIVSDLQSETPDLLGKSVTKSPSPMHMKELDMSPAKSLPSPQMQNIHFSNSSPAKVIRSPPQAREVPRLSHQMSPAAEPVSQLMSSIPSPGMPQGAGHGVSRDHGQTGSLSHREMVQAARQVAVNPNTSPRMSATTMGMSREQMQRAAQGMHAGVSLGNRRMSDNMSGNGMPDLQNNYIDLNAAAMISHQRQQAAANKAILDAITSSARVNMSGSASMPLSHPVISRQLSNPTQTGYLPVSASSHQPQMLSMMGRGNLQSSTTTPLSHMGMPPMPQSNVMHLAQQQQMAYNQVLLGYNNVAASNSPACSTGLTPGLQLPAQQVLLTSNANMFQDPSQAPGGTHPQSPYLPRFS